METNDAITALGALAQTTRLDIFRLLVQQGADGLAPGAIAKKLDLPNATLSFHLKELAQSGLVSATQEGRSISYTVNYPAMNDLVGFLTENCCGGKDCGVVSKPVKPPISKRKTA